MAKFLIVSLCLCTLLALVNGVANGEANASINEEDNSLRKFEVYDGVFLSLPREGRNDTDQLMSLDIDLSSGKNEGRGRRKRFMQRILPLFIVPFIVQSAIIPFFLSVLKFMLIKSLMVGKTALALIILNAFKNSNAFKGRLDQRMAVQHYGYHGNGMEEYGAYIN